MSLWKIAWRSLQQRLLASVLTGFSMALGIALVVAVLVVYGATNESFNSANSLGYNMIVGANKGGKLQLVLNTVYYISSPVENIPYSYYKEFKEGRFKPYCETVVPVCLGDFYRDFRVIGTTPAMFGELKRDNDQPYEFAEGRNFKSENLMEAVIGATVARTTGLKIGDEVQPQHGEGENAHVHEGFKIVGILKATGAPVDRGVFINLEGFYTLEGHALPEGGREAVGISKEAAAHAAEHDEHHDADHDHPDHDHPDHDHLANDHAEHDHDADHDHDEPAHDEHDHDHDKADHDHPDHDADHDHPDHDHEANHDHALDHDHDAAQAPAVDHDHDAAPHTDHEHDDHEHDAHEHADGDHDEHDHDAHAHDANAPDDHDHDAHEHADHDHDAHDHDAHAHDAHDHAGHHHHDHKPLPESQREVTAILILNSAPPGGFRELYQNSMIKEINKGTVAQAVQPIQEITVLFNEFVGPIRWLLLGLTGLIVVVSGVGILVSIYNSMNDRRRDIAIVRALGARRRTVMAIVLLESLLLSLLSGVAGWFLGHALTVAMGPWIAAQTGNSIGFWQSANIRLVIMNGHQAVTLPCEALIIPGLVILAVAVGFLPALMAYRTDVSKSLAA